jgi:repressor LexA
MERSFDSRSHHERRKTIILITVKGDSMEDAGILAGDIVVVERGVSANVGDIVVAVVDNEFTIKTLQSDRNGFYLMAANPAYPPTRAKGQLDGRRFSTGY